MDKKTLQTTKYGEKSSIAFALRKKLSFFRILYGCIAGGLLLLGLIITVATKNSIGFAIISLGSIAAIIWILFLFVAKVRTRQVRGHEVIVYAGIFMKYLYIDENKVDRTSPIANNGYLYGEFPGTKSVCVYVGFLNINIKFVVVGETEVNLIA